jgi:hypothetical protein
MSLTADSSIQEAYNDVRNDKTDTDWLVLEYSVDGKSLAATQTGKDGLTGLTSALGALNDGEPCYAYLRMIVSNDELSSRSKFALITWIPESTKPMRKAKMSVQSAEVKKVMPVYAIEVNASTSEDLDEAALRVAFTKAMGARY